MPHKTVLNKRGKEIPSVTEIIGILAKPFLYRWYGTIGLNECERIKRESSEFGTRIHEEVAAWLKDERPYEDLSPIAQVFARGYDKNKFRVIEVEPDEPYVSTKYGYQGSFDWVDEEIATGELRMNDLKITGQMHKEYPVQLSAYGNLFDEKHKTNIKKGLIYRVDKKTERLQVKEYGIRPFFKIFKCLIPVAKWLRGNNG